MFLPSIYLTRCFKNLKYSIILQNRDIIATFSLALWFSSGRSLLPADLPHSDALLDIAGLETSVCQPSKLQVRHVSGIYR